MTTKAGHTFTAGPWDYVAGTEHHGPYVAGPYGGDICDCYAMSNPMAASVRNGGTSFPINHQGEAAEANARLIAEAGTVAHETGLTPRQLAKRSADLLAALRELVRCVRGGDEASGVSTDDALQDADTAIANAEGGAS